MIEFNLLPDVKMEYLKTERTKRMVFSISVIVAAISVIILLLLFATLELQNHQISNNDKNITASSAKLTGTTNINKVLTVQNQLKTIVNLYDKTPLGTRLYDYLPELVPQSVTIDHLTLDFTTGTLKISGSAPNLETINTFADTLKFATYSIDGAQATNKAFSSVVLQSFARDQNNASYNFSIAFDPELFDRTHVIKLVVPSNYVSTRSFTELPQDLFKSSSPSGSGQ